MLHVAGTVLEVAREMRGNPGAMFEQITVAVLTGKSDVERVRLGRDFEAGPHGPAKYPVPGEGTEVVLAVQASAYSGRNGAGLQLTAIADHTDRLEPMLLGS